MRPFRVVALATAFLAVAPAFAQDNFPDVPANHWAYEALARMKKDGLLVGYPDGLYRGGRPASRYELAVAMHAVYTNLKNVTDGLDAQMRAVDGINPASAEDAARLRDAVAELQRDLAALKGYAGDIADLKRAALTFEKELTQLGVDVQAMKDDLKGLAERVARLEAKKEPLEISGEIDLWLGGGHAGGDFYGLTRDGRLTGIRNKNVPAELFGAPEKAGITDDLTFLHEVAVDFASTTEKGVRFEGTVVATNAFGQNPVEGVPSGPIAFGNQSDVFNPTSGNAGSPFLIGYGEGTGDLYLQRLIFRYDTRRANLEFGRVEFKATPWILQRIDNTLYFDDERWDNGEYLFDGAVVDTRLGPLKTQVYAGVDQERSVKNVRIDTIRSGPVGGIFGTADRMEAGRLLGGTFQTSVRGVGLRGDYLVLDADEGVLGDFGEFDRLDVMGVEANFGLGRFRATGGLRRSKGYEGGSHIVGLSDTAWDAKLAWASGHFDLWAQYREVGTNYLAPGDWGRLGILRNPTNIRGFVGSAKVALSPCLSLGLDGEVSRGLDDDGAAGTRLDRDTHINRLGVSLGARLPCGTGLTAYYENTSFSGLVFPTGSIGGSPRYQWYGLALDHQLAGNARFVLRYEQSAIRDDYQTTNLGGNDFRGGFLTSQVTVKF